MLSSETTHQHNKGRKWGTFRQLPVRVCRYVCGLATASESTPADELRGLTQEVAIEMIAAKVFASLQRSLDEGAPDASDRQLFNAVTTLIATTIERPDSSGEGPQSLEIGIRQLPDDARRVLELHISRGLSYREIAEVLDMSPEAALGFLKQAYSHLQHASRSPAPGEPAT